MTPWPWSRPKQEADPSAGNEAEALRKRIRELV